MGWCGGRAVEDWGVAAIIGVVGSGGDVRPAH